MKNSGIKSVVDFKRYKEEKRSISMVTCYDAAFARIADKSEVDCLLVGDSCGMVSAGYESTVPVTVDEIIYHAKAVRRGAPDRLIVADLPFLSYHESRESAVRNAGRILKETGANAVKLEGGEYFCDTVRTLVACSIPVMGHLGLTPQSVNVTGGYRVQGRDPKDAERMKRDAKALEDAGCFAIVLEMVPENLAREISESLSIPTIGIGAGRYCDGQVLVIYDLLGMNGKFNPKFLKKYANLDEIIRNAINEYSADVKTGAFPGSDNVF
ncbi:MAG TPA: 3-methyl-2-oxobutanoate hydroxymethyltransferase [Spirochaetota bacterium]|nr:3-methyl-2-oxobutanoate hydroxymethyltransferase [Spirochaetota bacterium]